VFKLKHRKKTISDYFVHGIIGFNALFGEKKWQVG